MIIMQTMVVIIMTSHDPARDCDKDLGDNEEQEEKRDDLQC